MNIPEDISSNIFSFLNIKDKTRLAVTSKELLNVLYFDLGTNDLTSLIKCYDHNTIDDWSIITEQNTCKDCIDYCHKCYKITDNLIYSEIYARKDWFDFNYCPDKTCQYNCSKCNTVSSSKWYYMNSHPNLASLTFNTYYKSNNNTANIVKYGDYYHFYMPFICTSCYHVLNKSDKYNFTEVIQDEPVSIYQE